MLDGTSARTSLKPIEYVSTPLQVTATKDCIADIIIADSLAAEHVVHGSFGRGWNREYRRYGSNPGLAVLYYMYVKFRVVVLTGRPLLLGTSEKLIP